MCETIDIASNALRMRSVSMVIVHRCCRILASLEARQLAEAC